MEFCQNFIPEYQMLLLRNSPSEVDSSFIFSVIHDTIYGIFGYFLLNFFH